MVSSMAMRGAATKPATAGMQGCSEFEGFSAVIEHLSLTPKGRSVPVQLLAIERPSGMNSLRFRATGAGKSPDEIAVTESGSNLATRWSVNPLKHFSRHVPRRFTDEHPDPGRNT